MSSDRTHRPEHVRKAEGMTERKTVSRRDFVRWGGIAAVAGASLAPFVARNVLHPEMASAQTSDPPPDLHLGGTDGWIYLPDTDPPGRLLPYHPDNLAPGSLNTYIFGFHNLTQLAGTGIGIGGQKNQAQASAPMFWATEGQEFRAKLTNLGLAQRPDLFDAHTIHWHGFRDVIPFFDGEPTGSVAVPAGRDFTYVYRPKDPGTYMFHCHVEDVEHVQMGMTGIVFVRPASDPKWVYNDASTAFDREFGMILTEVWAEAHWADAHIQLPEWSDYRADFSLINGRVYPDTIAPHSPLAPDTLSNPWKPGFVNFGFDGTSGDLIEPNANPELKYQPLSSLVTCEAGDKVLLRMANLGFKQSAMTLAGIPMHVVGKDATQLKGRDGTMFAFDTDTVMLGAGESAEAIFTAPAKLANADPYDTYLLYNHAFIRANNLAPGGFGGQMTEIRVYPTGSLADQRFPNDWGI